MRPPESYVHADGRVVVVPARVAAWLDHRADLSALRVMHRGVDAEVDAVLVALKVAALSWRTSATGSADAPDAEAVRQLPQWMTTNEAATSLNCTDRAIRLAIAEKRLEATRSGARWLISREDIEHFRAARAA